MITKICRKFFFQNDGLKKHKFLLFFSIVKVRIFTFFLKKWGQLFPEPGAYSSSFLNWAKTDGTAYKVATTNGCIMRQSPIALYSHIYSLSLEQCVELSHIFCFPTHKSDEAFEVSKKHITILYLMLQKTMNKEEGGGSCMFNRHSKLTFCKFLICSRKTRIMSF